MESILTSVWIGIRNFPTAAGQLQLIPSLSSGDRPAINFHRRATTQHSSWTIVFSERIRASWEMESTFCSSKRSKRRRKINKWSRCQSNSSNISCPNCASRKILTTANHRASKLWKVSLSTNQCFCGRPNHWSRSKRLTSEAPSWSRLGRPSTPKNIQSMSHSPRRITTHQNKCTSIGWIRRWIQPSADHPIWGTTRSKWTQPWACQTLMLTREGRRGKQN